MSRYAAAPAPAANVESVLAVDPAAGGNEVGVIVRQGAAMVDKPNTQIIIRHTAGAGGRKRHRVGLPCAGTDGIDGPTDAAGAIADTTTLDRARAAGLREPAHYLEENNAYAFFAALGDLILTGPTGTNVGDLQVILLA